MSFHCPSCAAFSLKIEGKLELPPDSRSDEITLQLIACSSCQFSGIAVYEESRRGALGSDSFSHIGYYVDADLRKMLKDGIRACPAPSKSNCACESHRIFGRLDASGRWVWLQDLRVKESFPMTFSV